MQFLELVRKRRSTRKYLSKPVPREAIDRCLEAARLAPSACNSQPWSFIVVDKDDLRCDLAAAAFSGPYHMNSFAKAAPVLIVVVTERSGYIATLGGYFKSVQYSLVDIGIACEHLVLQAEEEGLGTCWLGWFNEKAVKKALSLPYEKKIDIIISMGYPEENARREKPRKTLDEVRKYLGR
ncbi:MAG: nitroreductase family protein [Candidatus Omnitrophica bacterium]|nr:nitroreductase family protein [Candidatus Omnitrophota bacterium]MBU4488418.1 nitroreductase family protein [Candidatus Omnitrophota bacterium]MCG2704934.1 nitroreductase family protein [Candidatus Omnitrophota bacterium]